MTEDLLEYLKDNQQELGLKMLRHCYILAATRYGWAPPQTLPLGKDPDILVYEVIEAYLEGTRRFSPDHSVLSQLKQGVRSHLSSLYKRKEAHAQSLDGAGAESAPLQVPTFDILPDEQAANTHDTAVLYRMFAEHPKVKGNEDLELVLLALEDGSDDAASIRTATGLATERIYQMIRTLKTIVPDIIVQFQNRLP